MEKSINVYYKAQVYHPHLNCVLFHLQKNIVYIYIYIYIYI